MARDLSILASSVHLSKPTSGHILGKAYILVTLHRICFILPIKMIKKDGSCLGFFLLLGTFTYFVYGNLSLSTQYIPIYEDVHISVHHYKTHVYTLPHWNWAETTQDRSDPPAKVKTTLPNYNWPKWPWPNQPGRYNDPVFTKTAGLSDKTGKFSFCPAKIFSLSDSCPATLFNCQILIIDICLYLFKISFAFAFTFLGKKAQKQYH